MSRSLFSVEWTQANEPGLSGLSCHVVSNPFRVGKFKITPEQYKKIYLLTHEASPPPERSGDGEKIYMMSSATVLKDDIEVLVGYNKSFTDNNQLEWRYLSNGSFNVIYTASLTRDLVLENGVCYSSGTCLAYRIPIVDFNADERRDPGCILSRPDRIARLACEFSGMTATRYESGTVSPFIDGECASDAGIRSGVLADFIRAGRVVVDGIAKGNYRIFNEAPICVDVAFGIRPGSPMSELFWQKNRGTYQHWWRDNNARYPLSINMIKALLYLQETGINYRLADILAECDDMVDLLANAHDFLFYTKCYAYSPNTLNDFFRNPSVDKVTEEFPELLWLSSFYRYEDIVRRIGALRLDLEKIKIMLQFFRQGMMTQTIIDYDNNSDGMLFSILLNKFAEINYAFPRVFVFLTEFLSLEDNSLKQHLFSLLLEMTGLDFSTSARWLWQLVARDRQAFLAQLMNCDSFAAAKEYFHKSKREAASKAVPVVNLQGFFSRSANAATRVATAAPIFAAGSM